MTTIQDDYYGSSEEKQALYHSFIVKIVKERLGGRP